MAISGYPFFAPTAELKVAEAIATVDSTLALDGQQTSPILLAAIVKNVTITFGSRDVAAINTLGAPGQIIDKKKQDVTVAKFTLVEAATIAANKSMMEWLHGAGVAVGTTGYYRTIGGDKATGDRTAKSFLFKNSDGTNEDTVLLNNAWVTDIERSLDAEGHEELTVTVKCLASDTYQDYK